MHEFPTVESLVGKTPLVRLQRLPGAATSAILVKVEGNNLAGSVKDRPAMRMVRGAEMSGRIRPGDTLIEPTSGNTGIALAMAAAIRGYRMCLVMPENMSIERRALMHAYGARIILTPRETGMEGAIDRARAMVAAGEGLMLDQFSNPDNWRAHYESTGPEIWEQTGGEVTHFVSAMGTTGTIMGVSRYLKEKNPAVRVIGVQPAEGSAIPGIRRWPEEYLPKIYDPHRVDRIIDVEQSEAEETARMLAQREGLFVGISSGGAVGAALRLLSEIGELDKRAVIVAIACDRGDRYLSTNVFPSS
ncbi:MAG: cysteine synthase CysM [Chromatiales bacterium]|jgi:cysteine synthase B|nr:cysteine synthase CysM [Chromatiales bacterium]